MFLSAEGISNDDVKDFSREDLDHVLKGLAFKTKKMVWEAMVNFRTQDCEVNSS